MKYPLSPSILSDSELSVRFIIVEVDGKGRNSFALGCCLLFSKGILAEKSKAVLLFAKTFMRFFSCVS